MPVEVTDQPVVVDVETIAAPTIVEVTDQPVFVEVAAVGVQGRQGPPGQDGVDATDPDAFHLAVDLPTPLTTVDVGHDLNGYPAVTVVDDAAQVVWCGVEYLGPMAVRLTFSEAFTGQVFFS